VVEEHLVNGSIAHVGNVDGTPSESTHVLVRVWLPDRPGALGLVASRIGSVGGDIIGIDVLERGDNVAVDEFAVELKHLELLDLMTREIEQVDGASVEEVRVVGTFPDPRLDALESAAVLCEAPSLPALHEALLGHTLREFLANWTALVRDNTVIGAMGAGSYVPPAADLLAALSAGTAMSPRVADGTTGPDDLAVAKLPDHGVTLLVGRDGHSFRRRERLQLLALARIADRTWTLLVDRGARAQTSATAATNHSS
jgi:hypothetical protein